MAIEWSDRIPLRFRNASTTALGGSLAVLNTWRFPGGKGPLIFGPKGVGKTYAACALAMGSGEHPYYTHYVSLVHYFANMRRRMNGVNADVPDLSEAKLVILDDIGKERPTDWVREQTFELIDNLYNNEARLIVTSNSHPSALELHLGEFAFDRIKEITTCLPVQGESRR